MKFWELLSVLRFLRISLSTVDLDERWNKYKKWDKNLREIVDRQDRSILDSVVPDELCQILFSCSEKNLYFSKGYLRMRPVHGPDTSISVLEAYKLYGGEKVQDAIEKGLVKAQ